MVTKRLQKTYLVFLLLLTVQLPAHAQGRVVINEFMAWSGCNTTSEFIELLNFGPGPMNIGCYIVTNGTYAVTIPPNTILPVGKYYVLSGQNTLAQKCGNIDSAVHVDLNWTTCNCTNVAIPTTGNGFLADGGNANEKVVLLDPNLNVVDAISRNATPSTSVSITTPALSGGCSSKTFDLSQMNVSYEVVGSSTGIDNSYARKVDGDCGWVKTTDISANAPNKTGSTASTTYQFNTLSASECTGTTGRISIGVSGDNVAALFPMIYTLAYDADSNSLFNNVDVYTYGVDSTASNIDISNLAYGRYRITVGSSSGCNLKSFDFNIFNCYGVVLPLKLLYFRYAGIRNGQQVFTFRANDAANLKSVVLEGSNRVLFQPVDTLEGPIGSAEYTVQTPVSDYTVFRLRLVEKSGMVSYGPELKVRGEAAITTKSWPNPAGNTLYAKVTAMNRGTVSYSIVNATGATLADGIIHLNGGAQVLSFDTEKLKPGLYFLKITGTVLQESARFRFIK